MTAITGTVGLTGYSWLTWEVDAKLLRVWLHTKNHDFPEVVAMVPVDALRATLEQSAAETATSDENISPEFLPHRGLKT